jgi:hypothetical protein
MVIILADTLSMEHVIKFNAVQVSNIAISSWINNPASMMSIWNKIKEGLEYTVRLTDDELYIFVQLILGHELLSFVDAEYYGSDSKITMLGNWIAEYDDINATRPWKLEFKMLILNLPIQIGEPINWGCLNLECTIWLGEPALADGGGCLKTEGVTWLGEPALADGGGCLNAGGICLAEPEAFSGGSCLNVQ